MICRASAASGPVHMPARRRAALFKLLQIRAEIFERLILNPRGCRAQRLPVGLLRHQPRALGLDHVDGVGHVLAQLRIAQHRQRGHRKRRRQSRIEHGMVETGCLAAAALIPAPPPATPACWPESAPCESSSSAHTARCIAPPRCIRQLLSSAVQNSACVRSTSSSFTVSIADETSPFLH